MPPAQPPGLDGRSATSLARLHGRWRGWALAAWAAAWPAGGCVVAGGGTCVWGHLGCRRRGGGCGRATGRSARGPVATRVSAASTQRRQHALQPPDALRALYRHSGGTGAREPGLGFGDWGMPAGIANKTYVVRRGEQAWLLETSKRWCRWSRRAASGGEINALHGGISRPACATSGGRAGPHHGRSGRRPSQGRASGAARAVLLLGHIDTVWPAGTLATRPFRSAGGALYGPGVFDMKAAASPSPPLPSRPSHDANAPPGRFAMLVTADEGKPAAAPHAH